MGTEQQAETTETAAPAEAAPATDAAPSEEQTGTESVGSAPQSASPEQATGSPPESGGASVPEEWNGELEALNSAEWFKSLPEQHQELVRSGLQSKLSNFERGYQRKFQDVATERSRLENEIRAERERIQNMLYGVDDPTKDVRAELQRAVDDKGKLEAQLKQFEDAQREQQVDELLKWVEENGKGVYESDDAWKAFCTSMEAGIERETALKMASALVEKAPERTVPDSINMMNTGSAASNTESKVTDDYETVRRRLLAQG